MQKLLFLSISALLMAGYASAGVTQISQCSETPITAPGQYHVTQDLPNGGGPHCIVVQNTQDVEVHLDGHTLNGGILLENASNVTITGSGTLISAVGIIVLGGSGNTFVNVKVVMFGEEEDGIEIEGSPNATLISNTVTSTTAASVGMFGIAVEGSDGTVVRANDVSRFEVGIAIVGTTGALIQANKLHDNTQFDIFEGDACGANTFKGNQYTTTNSPCL